MTAQEIIARYDEERKNDEKDDRKLKWIRELEETLLSDVVLTHENSVDADTYFDNWGMTSTLIAPLAYADLYIHYLDMKINLKLNQTSKYNSAANLYNNTLITFQQYYNRQNKPLSKKKWFDHRKL